MRELIVDLDDRLLDHYLVAADDVRKCPKESCKYAGFLPEREGGYINCMEDLDCAQCSHRWKDPLQREQSFFQRLDLAGSMESFANNLRKILLTEPCPNCGVLIWKNSGCNHMNCAKCRFEFCWACLGRYVSYRHDHGMEQYCNIRKMVSGGIYVLFIALFFILKLLMLGSRDGNFLTKAPILDRLNDGESILTRENFLVTLATFLLGNAYAFATFILMIVTVDNYNIPPGLKFLLVVSEFLGSLIFAMSSLWLQFGAQIFFFEVTAVVVCFGAFWAGMALLFVGVICLGLRLVLWACWAVFYLGKFPLTYLPFGGNAVPADELTSVASATIDEQVTVAAPVSFAFPVDPQLTATASYLVETFRKFYPRLPF